jgi:hypothetical protein
LSLPNTADSWFVSTLFAEPATILFVVLFTVLDKPLTLFPELSFTSCVLPDTILYSLY